MVPWFEWTALTLPHTHDHSYLEGSMVDWARGEWYEEVQDGTPRGAKAQPWKGCVF